MIFASISFVKKQKSYYKLLFNDDEMLTHNGTTQKSYIGKVRGFLGKYSYKFFQRHPTNRVESIFSRTLHTCQRFSVEPVILNINLSFS